ncbi:NIF3-like protein 1 [Arapaima gigas]
MPPGWLRAPVRVFPAPRRLLSPAACPPRRGPSCFFHSVSAPCAVPRSLRLSPSKYRILAPPFPSIYCAPGFRSSRSDSLRPLTSPPCSFTQSSFLSRLPRSPKGMNLPEVLQVLEQLAPLSLAESWDNVGLLVEPSKPRLIQKILLTNDLTPSVMEEAEAMSCDLIVSYHPPLFKPIKRLIQKDWKQQLAVRAIEAGIAVYSPHTALDSVGDGINDWLVGALGSGCVSVLHQAVSSDPPRHKLEFAVRNREELEAILSELGTGGTDAAFSAARPDGEALSVSLPCPDAALPSVVRTLSRHPTPRQSLSILAVSKPPLLGFGAGRRSTLDEPVSIAAAADRVKAHLGLKHLRLALGAQKTLESTVTTVAVCAGSGGSVLQGVKADLYITGREMSHHEVLDAAAAGTSVILTEHSNSERGFLAVLRERLSQRLADSVSVHLSQEDRDPLEVV